MNGISEYPLGMFENSIGLLFEYDWTILMEYIYPTINVI